MVVTTRTTQMIVPTGRTVHNGNSVPHGIVCDDNDIIIIIVTIIIAVIRIIVVRIITTTTRRRDDDTARHNVRILGRYSEGSAEQSKRDITGRMPHGPIFW